MLLSNHEASSLPTFKSSFSFPDVTNSRDKHYQAFSLLNRAAIYGRPDGGLETRLEQMAYREIQLATLVDPDIGGIGPVQPTTYGNYSTLFPDPIVCFREMIATTLDEVYNR